MRSLGDISKLFANHNKTVTQENNIGGEEVAGKTEQDKPCPKTKKKNVVKQKDDEHLQKTLSSLPHGDTGFVFANVYTGQMKAMLWPVTF